MYCINCQYDLRGNAQSGACPECGRGFDAEDERSYMALVPLEGWRGNTLFWASVLFVGLVVSLVLTILLMFVLNDLWGLSFVVIFVFDVVMIKGYLQFLRRKKFGVRDGKGLWAHSIIIMIWLIIVSLLCFLIGFGVGSFMGLFLAGLIWLWCCGGVIWGVCQDVLDEKTARR